MQHPGETAVEHSFARLAATYGPALAIERSRTSVRWSFEGRSATATLTAAGVEAAFVDRPSIDLTTRAAVAAVYARPGVRYALDGAGCARMIDDIAAFFAGTREPRFAFVAVEEIA